MTTLEQMYEKAQQFAEEVEAAILKDDIEIIKEGKCTYQIKVINTKLDIWMANEPIDTRIFNIIIHSEILNSDFPKHRFKDPHAVRNALTAHSTNSMENLQEEHY